MAIHSGRLTESNKQAHRKYSYFLANSGCPFSSFLHIRHCHFSSVSTRFHYDSPPLPATTSSSPMWSMIQFEHSEWLQ